MSSLTKKSLFFLVLSTVYISTLTDGTEVCIANVHEVFLKEMPASFYFKLSMLLISRTVLESTESPEELLMHVKNHAYAFDQYADLDTTSLLGEENVEEDVIRDPTFNMKENPIQEKNQYISGYFYCLASKLKKMADYINSIALRPQQFCEDCDENEKPLCLKALYIMLSLKDGKSETEIDGMIGYNIFIHFYLNHTYDDFTKQKIFPELSSSDDDQSKRRKKQKMKKTLFIETEFRELSFTSGSGMNESIEEKQFNIITDYYNHMFFVSSKIAEHNEKEGLNLIPTVEEYCTEASDKKRKRRSYFNL